MYLIDAIHPVTCLLLCKNTEVDSKSKGELKCLTSQWPASKRNKELQRNCFEFAAENWDWRVDMIWHNGKLIHPVNI